MITREQYIENPCRVSSLPYWKTAEVSVPDNMKIVHDEEFYTELLNEYNDEPYFRLKHNMLDLQAVSIPVGYSVCKAAVSDYARHINDCYDDCCISSSDLQNYLTRTVYNPDLWLAVKNVHTGKIAATGIAELDHEIGEGILEWVQVSKVCRGCGLGRFIVSELLRRMKGTVRFVTVSGQCQNPTNPEALYRKCGFTGTDVWHILRKREL